MNYCPNDHRNDYDDFVTDLTNLLDKIGVFGILIGSFAYFIALVLFACILFG